MKDMTDLFKRFGQIQDLPVSEELLGAYLENRLDSETQQYVENEINNNNSLAELVDDSRISDAINDDQSLCDTYDQIEAQTMNVSFDTIDNYNGLSFDQEVFDGDFTKELDTFVASSLTEIDDYLNNFDDYNIEFQDQ